MRVGFSGTRRGMTDLQKAAFEALMVCLQPSEFRQGCCVGADAEATLIVDALRKREDYGPCRIIGLPGKSASGGENELRSEVAIALSDEVLPEETHFARNRRIVLHSDVLAATPWQSSEPPEGSGGGTFYTIQFARKQRCDVRIIWPNGTVSHG